MRSSALLLLLLTACASPGPAESPAAPADLAESASPPPPGPVRVRAPDLAPLPKQLFLQEPETVNVGTLIEEVAHRVGWQIRVDVGVDDEVPPPTEPYQTEAEVLAASIRGPRARLWRAALSINRANALRLAGDLTAAIEAYGSAARESERAGDAHTAAIARTNAGVAHMDAGNARQARKLLGDAAKVFEEAGQTDMALEARYNLAGALVRDGELGQGLVQLERLEAEHEARGLHRRAALCAMDLADAFARAGDHPNAERRALAAADSFRRSGAAAERVEALWVAAASAARHAPGAASDQRSGHGP